MTKTLHTSTKDNRLNYSFHLQLNQQISNPCCVLSRKTRSRVSLLNMIYKKKFDNRSHTRQHHLFSRVELDRVDCVKIKTKKKIYFILAWNIFIKIKRSPSTWSTYITTEFASMLKTQWTQTRKWSTGINAYALGACTRKQDHRGSWMDPALWNRTLFWVLLSAVIQLTQ